MNITINVWGHFEGNLFHGEVLGWNLSQRWGFVSLFFAVLGLKPSSFPARLSAGWGCSVWTWDKRLDRRGSTHLNWRGSAAVASVEEQIKHSEMFPFILPPLWRAPALLPAALSSPPPPHPSLTPSLWMSCPRITGACGGLSETCVQGWRRPMGSPSSSAPPPPTPSWWGRKALSEF